MLNSCHCCSSNPADGWGRHEAGSKIPQLLVTEQQLTFLQHPPTPVLPILPHKLAKGDHPMFIATLQLSHSDFFLPLSRHVWPLHFESITVDISILSLEFQLIQAVALHDRKRSSWRFLVLWTGSFPSCASIACRLMFASAFSFAVSLGDIVRQRSLCTGLHPRISVSHSAYRWRRVHALVAHSG